MKKSARLLAGAGAALALVAGTTTSATAAVPPTGSTQCKVSISITGSHTFHVKANTCKYDKDDPGAAVMVVRYKFFTNDKQTNEHGVSCNAYTIAKCLAEYTYTAPNPAGTQTFRVNTFVQWAGPLGRVDEHVDQTDVRA